MRLFAGWDTVFLSNKLMFQSSAPKLLKWLAYRFLFFFVFSVFFSCFCFYLFFKNGIPLFNFLFVFLFGFFICSLGFLFLFVRFLYPLDRVFKRVEKINQGKSSLDTVQDSFLDEEPGEFYEINKNLNQIDNYLRWQKRVISQESSELEAVISALTGAILAIDQDRKILFFNNQAASLFSSQRKSYKKEIFLSEAVRNPDILQAYNKCLETGKVIKRTLSIGVFDTDEKDSIYEITVAPFKTTDVVSSIHGAVGSFYDISNVRKTEKIQLDFITNVSHELRTPLTAIQGYVETLLEEVETNNKDQIQHFLNIIQRNVQRLVSLLNHFLDLSKMDSMAGKKEQLNTELVTKSIVKDLHIKNHKIKTDFSQKTVKADPHFLKQVLYNLLDNAVRYVPQGRLIEILWTKEKDHVVLTVRDHGEGISEKHKDRLFERFYRVDPARKGAKGVGIGLSIVKQLIEKQGGAVKIQSEPQAGSSFICYFPDKEEAESKYAE